MSRKYKFQNKEGLYFISFATVYWIDVFVREQYFTALAKSLQYCCTRKGMVIYAYCIMPSHIHLIFNDQNSDPGKITKEFKSYSSKLLQSLIEENAQESRKEWMLWMMQRAGKMNSNVKYRQFWQQNNKPIELWSNKVISQKLNYIHNNPVEAGFVEEAIHWKYSSAKNYAGEIGQISVELL
ncbi:MAG: transposase [Labilibaculum antarcticum]